MTALLERIMEKVLIGEATAQIDFGSLHKIVVCQRGFVYAGDVTQQG